MKVMSCILFESIFFEVSENKAYVNSNTNKFLRMASSYCIEDALLGANLTPIVLPFFCGLESGPFFGTYEQGLFLSQFWLKSFYTIGLIFEQKQKLLKAIAKCEGEIWTPNLQDNVTFTKLEVLLRTKSYNRAWSGIVRRDDGLCVKPPEFLVFLFFSLKVSKNFIFTKLLLLFFMNECNHKPGKPLFYEQLKSRIGQHSKSTLSQLHYRREVPNHS